MNTYNTKLQTNNINLQDILNTINELPEAGSDGITLPVLTNPAIASDILNTKEAIDSNGNKIIGTIPSIEGTTITPTTEEQTAVTAGTYVIGDIKVGAVENGGNTDIEDALVERTVIEYSNDRVTTIGSNAFCYCYSLTSVNFPKCSYIGHAAFLNCISLTSLSFPVCTYISEYAFSGCSSLTSVSFPMCSYIGSNAFRNCTSLTSINFPVCSYIGSDAFYYCSSLTSVNFPVCTYISEYAFYSCSSLTSLSFPVCTKIGNNAFAFCKSLTTISFPVCTYINMYAFNNCISLTSVNFPVCTYISSGAFRTCYNLTTLILGASKVCTLSNSTVFTSTPIGGYSTSAGKYGTIYVPASLLASYQAATNWTYFSSRFATIESLDETGGNLITFFVKATEYQAEEGMTWQEWIDSDYNSDNGYIIGNEVYNEEGMIVENVVPSDIIVENNVYSSYDTRRD